MFKFKKKDERKDDLSFNSEELDLNDLEKEIVELVDIVEESDSELSMSGEFGADEPDSGNNAVESPLDAVEFPTEVRQLAEEFDDRLPGIGDVDEPTSLDLEKEIGQVTQKRPYGDKVIAETLGLGDDDSLVAALKSEKIMGFKDTDKKETPGERAVEDPLAEDRTLLVNVPDGISDLKSDLDSEDEEGLLTLTEELNDEKNTTVDTAALKNCPLIEDSAEVELRRETVFEDEATADNVNGENQEIQETRVDLSLSQILSTDSLETDLKEELKEDFMTQSAEAAYEETQVEMPSPDLFELEEEEGFAVSQENSEEPEDGIAGFSTGIEEDVSSEAGKEEGSSVVQVEAPRDEADIAQADVRGGIDQELIVEELLRKIQPDVMEIVAKSVREQLPEIIERVVREEITKIKKYWSEN